MRIDVVQAQGADGGHLGDVFAGFGPVEVRLVARKNDNTARRAVSLLSSKTSPARSEVMARRKKGCCGWAKRYDTRSPP